MSKRLLFMIVTVAFIAPQPNFGSPIGELNITGAWRVFAAAIDFFPPDGPPAGEFSVEPASTGAYAPLIGTDGDILDLDATLQPVGSPFLLSDFITFVANPNIRWDLTFIEPGIFTSAGCAASPPMAGQTCTPAFPPPSGSPFNLINTSASSSIASFRVRGMAHDLSDGTSLPWVGEFTSQFPTDNYQDLLADLAAAGFVEKSFSFTGVVVPEPGSGVIFLIGLGALAAGRLIRQRRQ